MDDVLNLERTAIGNRILDLEEKVGWQVFTLDGYYSIWSIYEKDGSKKNATGEVSKKVHQSSKQKTEKDQFFKQTKQAITKLGTRDNTSKPSQKSPNQPNKALDIMLSLTMLVQTQILTEKSFFKVYEERPWLNSMSKQFQTLY